MAFNSRSIQSGLREQFGDIDIYAFDALLQGYWFPPMRFLDAGCGTGRNLPFFLSHGFEVSAIDVDDDALEVARELARIRYPEYSQSQFRSESIESCTFVDASFDAILCNAVLHFSRDENHFVAQLQNLWRMLAPGGTVLIRLGTRIGLEDQVQPLGAGRYLQPDGSKWFLPDALELADYEVQLGAQRWKPLKTALVVGRRSMTTWWLRKQG
jgi:tellurite methyltransferase